MGRIVIVACKPKPGKAEALKELTKTHVPRLKKEGLVTDREAVIMETADGAIIEVFEWLSADAIKQAHSNPAVHQMWAEYAEVCDYVPLNSLSEAGNMFAEFTALD
jgi:quinol monooxygenase YgiN